MQMIAQKHKRTTDAITNMQAIHKLFLFSLLSSKNQRVKNTTATNKGIIRKIFTNWNHQSKYTFPKSKITVKNLEQNIHIVAAIIKKIPNLNAQQQQQVSSLDVGSWTYILQQQHSTKSNFSSGSGLSPFFGSSLGLSSLGSSLGFSSSLGAASSAGGLASPPSRYEKYH